MHSTLLPITQDSLIFIINFILETWKSKYHTEIN